jgi:peptidoglycan/LPS O-acetylase OafA/YrhL
LDVLTKSSSGRPERNGAARASVLFGLLAVAEPAVALGVSHYSSRITLVQAVAGATAAALFGALALVFAGKAKRNRELTLGRIGGTRQARAGRILGALGIAAGLVAGISLVVYAVLSRAG